MYLSRLFNRVRPIQQQTKFISSYPTLRDSKATTNKPSVGSEPVADAKPSPNAEAPAEDSTISIGRKWIEPSDFDKKILVWMKSYKTIDEIPKKVNYETMDKAQNRFRIRCCNLMIFATMFCFFISVKLGKRRAEQGENLENINEAWHNKINEEYQAGLKKAAAAKVE